MRYGLLFLMLTVLALSAGGARAGESELSKPELLKYEDFLQKLRADQIKSLTIGNWPFSQMEGIYTEGDTQREFFSQRPLQAANDPLLLELLEKHQVSVVKKEQPKAGTAEQLARYAPELLVLVVPSALLVFVIIYLVKMNKKIDQVIIR